MITTISPRLSSYALSVLLITVSVTGEGGRIGGQERHAVGEPTPTSPPARWRRGTYTTGSCPTCEGVTHKALVTVFSDYDGQGKLQGYYEVGRYRADQGQLSRVGNDTVSSLRVEDGFAAKLCQDEGDGHGAGKCETFGPGDHNVSDEMDNETSFIWVFEWKPPDS